MIYNTSSTIKNQTRHILLKPLKDENPIVAKAYDYVLEYFKGDEIKALTWFFVENPMLGEIRPFDMVLLGKADKVLAFIESAREGNF